MDEIQNPVAAHKINLQQSKQRKKMKNEQQLGYFAGFERINDPERFAAYPAQALPTIESHGGTIIAIAQQLDQDSSYCEKDVNGYHLAIVLKFPSPQKALDWYNSAEYKEAKAIRLASSDGSVVMASGQDVGDDQALLVGMVNATSLELQKYNPDDSIAKFQGRIIFRTRTPAISEGFDETYDFAVLLSFPTIELATSWMNSEEYQEMKTLRLTNSTGTTAILKTA